jgi:hypothetical protein
MVREIRGLSEPSLFQTASLFSHVIPYAERTLSQPLLRTDNTRRLAPNAHFLVGIYRR